MQRLLVYGCLLLLGLTLSLSFAQVSYVEQNGSKQEDTRGASRFLHYLPEDIPIDVFVSSPDVEGGDVLKQQVVAAFEAWQSAAGDLVRFRLVDSPDEETLRVTWIPFDDGRVGSYQYVYAVQRDGVYRFRTSEIFLDPRHGSEDAFRYALLEVGHALGLLGRSPFEGDAMSADPSGVVSERDVATLRALYDLPSGSVVGGDARPASIDEPSAEPVQTETEQEVVESVSVADASSVDVRVSTSEDDAEERSMGRVNRSSKALELTVDPNQGPGQLIGMRFVNVNLPEGARVTGAYVQFTADQPSSEATSLTIGAEASGDAGIFTSSNLNLSSRERTVASVTWSPEAWSVEGESGVLQRTPDLASVIQEVVSRPDWQSGNALVILIEGSGRRVAASYDGDAAAAPLLHIEYGQ
ncbi:MAG: hypothetical protein JSV66_11050 [Trueperaceae bacterium]|nr:MAG: hypothetical protein JSV66_11050 [Trueperaceae bacterium]